MRDRKSCDIRSLPHLPPPFTPSLDDQPFGLVYWDDQLVGLGESYSLLLYWDDEPSGLGESHSLRTLLDDQLFGLEESHSYWYGQP